MENSFDLSHWAGHLTSLAAIFGFFVGVFSYIPGVLAATAAFIWYLIQIWQSPPLQRWAARRRAKKIARLKAKLLLLKTDEDLDVH